MNPRTGRPPLPENERRTVTMKIRLTKDESDLLAAAAPPGKVAEWARTKLLNAARAARRKG